MRVMVRRVVSSNSLTTIRILVVPLVFLLFMHPLERVLEEQSLILVVLLSQFDSRSQASTVEHSLMKRNQFIMDPLKL